ncbi:MAG: glycosyltransferase family 4 protein [Blastocatellia bacterium]|nr:glycosyltransferase family 4 protein [Blastocatellia bacterium]MCS7156867.1 glycosyltransferase family 4 protein [Blastocatellia bacterium]MCX7752825.1 glycosyltransferase family 4 protein [Blastocatellia bacterium]MDW8167559.1 glycosyltransferase family 4 protein [Acidobacteriota bacterium]MDW8256159.1 glycosyltransferase family 4 protein [Acidobacteriota bacterium]
MRVALYNPGWHVMGGGEVYLGVIAEILAEQHHVDLIAVRPFDLRLLRERLGLCLNGIGLIEMPSEAVSSPRGVREWLWNRRALARTYRALERVTRTYDVAIALESDLPPPLAARRNILQIQVPHRRWTARDLFHALRARRLADIRREIARALYFPRALRRYDLILCNSHFTARIVEENWRPAVPMFVLPPPVELPTTPVSWDEKRDIILSVARFFRGGHEKNQRTLIEAFRMFVARHPGWELHLVGGADASGEAVVTELEQHARGVPVVFHVNAERAEVRRLYRLSKVFWHATGFDVDEDREPERVEHFGIALVEAMGYGCIPFAVGRGGPREIIEPGGNGFFWETLSELVERTAMVIADPDAARISVRAAERARTFGRAAFRERFLEVLARVL